MVGGFEDLEVWKKAKDIAVKIYIQSKDFPKEDQYGITSQIRRSALSIASNIAEGCSRGSKKEFARFLLIAQGSCSELRTQLIVTKEIGIIEESDYKSFDEELKTIGRMLKGLERKQKEAL